MKYIRSVITTALLRRLWVIGLTACCCNLSAQTIYQYKQPDATICFFDKELSKYIPHLMRKYQTSRILHKQIWDTLPTQSPFMMLTDWEDDGNAGVGAIPHTTIQIGMAPLNMSYFVAPSNERYDHLFKHEYTHVVMSDKSNSRDDRWRKFTGNKVVPDSEYPLSSLWSYLDAPRWYAPRWYHEGIACFMETWLTNGAGRALGGYDETYFRTHIKDSSQLYSIVGLETEGKTSDFQQGATSYLYGTRFINYLVLVYGYQKVIEFYNRTEDSKTSYTKQFSIIFGKDLRDVWEEWLAYEKVHQTQNLEKIAEYPLTELQKITEENLGAMSPMVIDDSTHMAYAAVNHPGDFPHIAAINLNQLNKGKQIRKLALIDGDQSYQTAYLAYDRKRQRLIWTDRNFKLRGLVVYDIGKNRKINHFKYQRVSEIVYDNTNDCMYGLMSNQGVTHLIKYDSTLENREVLFSFPFGVSVSDLDVSHDGTRIVAAMLGSEGQHSLIMFNISDFENAIGRYETLYTLDDCNLSQFRFSEDDSRLLGFSYYTGVPNIWTLNLDTKEFDLLSNVQTGLFAPYMTKDSTIYALEYSSDGMTPVKLKYKVLHDANSVEFLGQKAYNANPQLASLSTSRTSIPQISFGEIYDSISEYKPLRELKFQGIYPDISGFTDRKSWNNVTPVVGCHLAFYDPLSLCSIKFFAGTSPWSNNEWKNRFHVSAELKYWQWKLRAGWNECCFYDLFGPRRSSRNGYSISLSYESANTLQMPFQMTYGGSIAHYGDMDALPLYQEVKVDEDINSFQTLNLYLQGGKVRGSIGAQTPEQGYRFGVNTYTYLANGKFFPSADISFDKGFLLPVGLHNAFWVKGVVGQCFGDSKSSLGNIYFGGFRNNYVDNGTEFRYRTINSMPGAGIDQICAHSFAKITGEVNICPIRLNNFGALQCYPNYIQFNLFASKLFTDYWGSEKDLNNSNYLSLGAQMNIPMVLFSNMKTTLSVGYARTWGDELNRNELMISLKLL